MKSNVHGWLGWLLCVALLSAAKPLCAHPMGNFSINHYTRLVSRADHIDGLFVLDMAEIPTVTEMSRLDADQDGMVSEAERAAYLRVMGAQLSRELALTVDGLAVPLAVQAQSAELRAGAGGLKTLRLTLNFRATLPPVSPNSPQPKETTVEYKDNNFPVRTGWKEIVVQGEPGVIHASSVPAVDVSHELTVYPSDPSIAPPQVTEARFTLAREVERKEEDTEDGRRKTEENAIVNPGVRASTDAVGRTRLAGRTQSSIHDRQSTIVNRNTPQDRFTQSIAVTGLTPALMLLSLLSAFGFGALHALSPGHGKAMVAAYLIGTRGTARHAVLLGLVVTLTHTIGVFALGLVTLTASRYVVPERLYPLISALSGLAIAVMGAGLLWSRVRAWRTARAEQAETPEETGYTVATGVEEINAGASVDVGTAEFYYQRRDTDPLSLRTLIGLGITGGALPCPSALVVMLSAIALHRVGFGLLLIVAFSLGLAVVLTVLGLVVMRARGMMERVSPGAKWLPGLSILSAAAVTLIGIALCFRSLTGGF